MSKIKSKIFSISIDSPSLEKNINDWLEKNPQIYIIDTCGFGQDLGIGVVLFYGIRDKQVIAKRDETGKPKCSVCSSTMVIRSSNSTGELFWGCPKYPKCKCSFPFTEEDFEREYGKEPEKDPNKEEIPF